ncbi:MAG: SBBP repeat-containing protein [Terriglobales bacterium]
MTHSKTIWWMKAALGSVVVLAVAGTAFRLSTSSFVKASAQNPAANQSLLQPTATHAPISASTLSLPLYFEPNQGQTDPHVKFLARGAGYGLFLTANEAVLALQRPASTEKASAANGHRKTQLVQPSASSVIRMRLDGAAPSPLVEAAQPLPGKSNYFIGNNPAKWRRNIPQFGQVEYKGVYPGVDLVYYGNDRDLEYDFRVAPGADASQIALSFQGASARLDNGDLVLSTNGGDIRFHAPHIYQQPSQQQAANGQQANQPSGTNQQIDVAGSFHLLAANKVGFTVGPYDHSRELVIDPTLSYSTYLGGTGTQSLVQVAVDQANNIYLAGSTTSSNFPVTSGAYQASLGGSGAKNIFIAVLNPAASPQLTYATYLGGSGSDDLAGIAVDLSANIYVAGTTTSTNFPTSATAFQPTASFTGPQTHGFVTEFSNASGVFTFNYSTYLAGNGNDIVSGVAADNNGDAYVTGTTTSTNDESNGFPSNSFAYQICPFGPPGPTGCNITSGPPQFFASKLYTGGTGTSSMLYSTYFGGGSGTIATGGSVAVDSSGYMYFTGTTNMQNFIGTGMPAPFPILNATQPCLDQPGVTTCALLTNPAKTDAILVKLNPSQSEAGVAPFYSTYLGGSGDDIGTAVAVDSSDNAYVTGSTTSSDWSCTGFCIFGPNPPFGDNDTNATSAFIAQITNQSQPNTIFPLSYFAWIGGSSADGDSTIGNAIAVDSVGTVHVAGNTTSPNLPINFPFTPTFTTNYLQPYQGDGDAFVALVVPSILTTGDYITYLGGTGLDQGTGIAVDSSNNTYVAGSTVSAPCSSCTPPAIVGFPITTNAYQPHLAGSDPNAFVTVLGSNSSLSVVENTPSPSPVNAGQQATFTFNITNNGPDPATNINFYVQVPTTGYTILPTASILTGIGTCAPLPAGGNVIPCYIQTLAAAAVASVQVQVTPPAPPPNPASITVGCSFSVNGGPLSKGCPSNGQTQTDDISDFTMSSSPTTLTVQNGNLASFVITLAPDQNTLTKAYDGTITMSESPSPSIVAASTPTFTNPTVTLDGSGSASVSTTLNIQTVARPVNSGSLFRRTSFYATWLPIGGLSLAGLGLGAGRRRRRWIVGALLVLLAGVLLLQPACGSSSSNVNTNQGTAAGQYTITITGSASTNASHQLLLTLNVT